MTAVNITDLPNHTRLACTTCSHCLQSVWRRKGAFGKYQARRQSMAQETKTKNLNPGCSGVVWTMHLRLQFSEQFGCALANVCHSLELWPGAHRGSKRRGVEAATRATRRPHTLSLTPHTSAIMIRFLKHRTKGAFSSFHVYNSKSSKLTANKTSLCGEYPLIRSLLLFVRAPPNEN